MANKKCEHNWECLNSDKKSISYICIKCGKTNVISEDYINQIFTSDTNMDENLYYEEYIKNLSEDYQLYEQQMFKLGKKDSNNTD